MLVVMVAAGKALRYHTRLADFRWHILSRCQPQLTPFCGRAGDEIRLSSGKPSTHINFCSLAVTVIGLNLNVFPLQQINK